jgi:hypothetical protein
VPRPRRRSRSTTLPGTEGSGAGGRFKADIGLMEVS